MIEFDDELNDLEPGDDNPLDAEQQYNPLNHSFPMNIETADGPVEIMVKFAVVRGKENLPVEFINDAEDLQIPVSIEDVPISEEGKTFQIPEDIFGEQTPADVVAEGALLDELAEDPTYYLIPMIVRARRLVGPADENILGEVGGDLISKEETAELIPPDLLLARLRQYREEVTADEAAPTALLDLLDHFMAERGRPLSDDDVFEDPDSEWNEEEGWANDA